MSKPLLIACEILHDEIEHVLRQRDLGDEIEVRWMDSSLHGSPDVLRDGIQDEIDSESGRPVILLGYGNCGNAMVGIRAGGSPVVIPRKDDCISLMLPDDDSATVSSSNGSVPLEPIDRMRRHTYFLTRGWLEGDRSLEKEYSDLVERRGQKKADRAITTMYASYDTLMIIDTGAYDVSEQMENVERISSIFDMAPVVCSGDLGIVERLLTGVLPYAARSATPSLDDARPASRDRGSDLQNIRIRGWDPEEFVIIAPNLTSTLSDFFPELSSRSA